MTNTAEKFPQEIVGLLDTKGIAEEEILFFLKSDINADYIYGEVYCVVTADTLSVLSGKQRLVTHGTAFSKKASVDFNEMSYEEYAISELSDFACDKNISSGILSCVACGERITVCRYSLALSSKVRIFVDNITNLCENGTISAEDIKHDDTELFCPKCGNRYTDAKRKICPKCMDKAKLFRRLSVFFSRYKFSILISVLSLFGMTALSTFLPFIKGNVFYDEVLAEGGELYGQVLYVVVLMVLTQILNIFVSAINGIIMARISAKVVFDIKKTVFDSISKLSYGFFTSRQTGGLMTSVNADADSIYGFFCDILPWFLINTVKVVAISAIMFVLEPGLAALSLLTVPVFLFVHRYLTNYFHKLYARNFSLRRSMNSLITDVLQGIRVVKAFAHENEESQRFDRRSKAFSHSDKEIGSLNSTAFPIIDFVLYIGNFVVWGYGGWLVMRGNMTYGTLMTFVGYLGMLYAPLNFFAEIPRFWAQTTNSIQRVFEILDSIPDVPSPEEPVKLGIVRGEVSFSNVSFSYEKTRNILENIDFHIMPGQTIGIVGETGAGKSTLVNLLIRLYDVDEGKITIDGVDVRDIAFDELHSNVAIVSQETYLFSGSILENIRYAKPDASDYEVMLAAKAADAHSFIIKLPDGYETRVGMGNKELSGGERQRVSIARAILKNPKILILDEATSAMDTATERRIQRALSKLVKGRTTIMIAHRLSTLRDADKIVVIDHGRMPEYGTHKELIAQKGVYHKLYKMQAEALKSIGIE